MMPAIPSSAYSTPPAFIAPLPIIATNGISFIGDNGVVFTLKANGAVVKGPGFIDNDQTTKEFLDALGKAFPAWRAGLQQPCEGKK
jgi:hypothetical protein